MESKIWAETLQDLEAAGITGGYAILVAVIMFLICNLLWIGALFLVWKFSRWIIGHVFMRLEEKKGQTLYLEFLRRTCGFLVTMFCIVSFLGWQNIRQSLLGSATVLAAIVGFAGQDIIKDTLAGLQISLYRPFDIGDRIELEDGSAGIVESITMRHVVIKKIDTVRAVIPNSRLNALSIQNYSYRDIPRSILLKFPVGYTSDIEKTKAVISDVIRRSPCSLPGKTSADGKKKYAPVYFLELADSALIMAVTVYYNHDMPTEQVKDAINSGVFQALQKNGIEIPYNYVNVVTKKE